MKAPGAGLPTRVPFIMPYDTVDIRLTLKDGVMRTYINGMLDQTVTLRSNNRNY